MKKNLAELFGTFTLTSIVILSLTSETLIDVPIAAALTVMLFVYTIGSVSGAHLNPAVTLGIMSIGKIGKKEGFIYIVYQFIGASLSLLLLSMIGTISNPDSGFDMASIIGEIFGTIFLTFGIASVVFGKVQNSMSGIVVGGSLLLGILFAAYIGSNGVLNPAVAFGIGSFGIAYVMGPVIGSVIGFNLYKFLSK